MMMTYHDCVRLCKPQFSFCLPNFANLPPRPAKRHDVDEIHAPGMGHDGSIVLFRLVLGSNFRYRSQDNILSVVTLDRILEALEIGY